MNVSHDTIVSNKHKEQTRHYYVNFQQQEHIAHSSMAAECISLSDCGRQGKWLWQLLGELGYNLHPIPVCSDNQGSIFMASNPVTKARSKHIDIKWHSIQEVVSNKIIELFFVEGAQNPANMLMKNLGQIKFNLFRSQLELVFYDCHHD